MNDITVGPAADIPVGEGRTYVVEGQQIAIFRLRDGSLRALDAVCPHRGGPLADGLTDADVVVCPLHGFTYDLRTGDEIANEGMPVTAYPVHTDDTGMLHLRIDPATHRQRNGALSQTIQGTSP
jgi:nitrite reductase (NADH) small subunit